MARYVDGFVITLSKKNLSAYKKIATLGKKIWMEYGALDYKECVLEDDKPKMIELHFRKLTGAKASETVLFSFITFKSKAHRDKVNAKVMADPRMKWDEEQEMPFTMDKMAYGGFEVLVDGV